MRSLLISLSLTTLLCSCSTPDYRVTGTMAGKIGCPANEIAASNELYGGLGVSPTTWRATCRGQKFVCSVAPGSHDLNEMSCAPEIETGVKVIPAYDPSADPSEDPLGG